MERTKEKKNLLKQMMLILCAAMVVITTVLGGGATEVQAASKNQKALRAYAKYLKNGKNWNDNGKYTTFGLIDVDRDGVKELVVRDDSVNCEYLYDYRSGKVKEIGSAMCGALLFYPKKKIFCSDNKVTAGEWEEIYYKYSGKKATEIAYAYYSVGEEDGEEYRLKGKKVSKKKYDKYMKSMNLGVGLYTGDMKMHKNTKSNRDKYLK